MSETYLMAEGWGVAFGSLDPFLIQPRCEEGIVAAQRDIAADGSVHELGLHGVLEWPVIDGEADLQAQLGQMGLDTNFRNQLTVWVPDYERVFRRYNVWAVRPRVITFRYFPQALAVTLNRAVLLG